MVYTFVVAPDATKPEIRSAVEALFDVSVVKVNTLCRKGKRHRNRRTNTWGRRPRLQTCSGDSRSRRFHRDIQGVTVGIRKRRPSSPGRRFQTVSDFSEISRSSPECSLLVKQSGTGGRNNHGRKTARHRGGAHKQRYRKIDFARAKTVCPPRWLP